MAWRTLPFGMIDGVDPCVAGVTTTCCSSGVMLTTDGRQPAVPLPGAADAGAVAGRAHPAGVLRHRVPRARPRRRVPVPAHGRSALPDPRQALVADHAGAFRGRRRHGHHPLLRAWAALAGLDA